MSGKRGKEETFYPCDIFAAVQHAKKTNSQDKFGDEAFNLDVKGIRDGNNGTRWMTFSCKKKMADGSWKYLPLKLRTKNLRTAARIRTDEEKKDKGKNFPGISLTFKGTSTFPLRRKDPKSGKFKESTEEYGKAKVLIAKAFNRLMKKAIDSDAFFLENKKISLNVQMFRWIDKKVGKKEKLDDPPIRVSLPFEKHDQSISKYATPTIEVKDANKPIKNKEGKIIGFQLAVDESGKPYNYTTIRDFIRCGSNTSFIEDLSGVCLSAQGASNPARIDGFLIVKKGTGNKINETDAYDADDFDDIAGAETGGADDAASGSDNEAEAEKTTKVTAEDIDLDDGDLEASTGGDDATGDAGDAGDDVNSGEIDDLDDDDF